MKQITIFSLLIFFSLLSAQTIINGGSVSGSWTAAQSPYHVMESCVIPADETLTIEPGTEVYFASGALLQVSGCLKAEGTVADSVIFDALNPNTGWNGIRCYATATTQQDSTIFTYCRLSNACSEDGYWNCRGGALLLHNSGNQRIEHCVFEHNTADYGGGAYLYNSPAIIRYCTFRCNEASHDGGGIQISSGSHALVKGCLFEYNECMYDGGGLFIAGDNQTVVEECIIRYNGAMDIYDCSACGGGISIWGASPVIKNSSILRNKSYGVSGGVIVSNDAGATFENCLIESNWSSSIGGMYVYQSDVTMQGVVIRYNSSSGMGGGLDIGYQSEIFTSSLNPCDIYLNNSYCNDNLGNDVVCSISNSVTLHLGTFTFLQPTEEFAYPLGNFTFDIQQGYCAPVTADLYVSPDGLPTNSGLSPGDPIQSVFQAITMIQSTVAAPCTIHMAEGVYSMETTHDVLPLELKDGLTLSGSGMNTCILDADTAESCLISKNATDAAVQNCTGTGASVCGFITHYTNLVCTGVRLTGNYSTFSNAAGMDVQYDCNVSLINCRIDNNGIDNNTPWNYGAFGGGIACYSSTLNLAGTVICDNFSTNMGGGLTIDNASTILWDADNRSSVYNNCTEGMLYGADVYYGTQTAVMDVIVDTFTVMTPQERHAYPLNQFTFDIQHCSVPQIAADLYVSPSGDDANSGLSADEPLRTITAASQRILGSDAVPHTIHLAEGTYSTGTTGEYYPILIGDYISIVGTATEECIMDGESLNTVLILGGIESSCQNITVMRGKTFQYDENGAGILTLGEDFTIQNTVVKECVSGGVGGGVYVNNCSGELDGVHVVHCNTYGGGAMYFDESQVVMKNCSIRENSSRYGTGGLHINQSTVLFDQDERSSIYNNHSHGEYWAGNDLGSDYSGTVSVVVDTFTVMQPDGMTASPVSGFSFDIEHCYITQYTADIYASPDGAITNSGLSPDEPVASLNQALLSCLSTETDPHTIHLLPGTYRDAESFPYSLLKPITIEGSSVQDVVLDANEYMLFLSDNIHNICLRDFSIQNGYGSNSCMEFVNSTVHIERCNVHDVLMNYGSIVSSVMGGSLIMKECLFYNNAAESSGGILRIEDSYGVISNCTFANHTTNSFLAVRVRDASAIFLNSIFWNNGDSQFYYNAESQNYLVIDNSLVQGGEDSIIQYGSGSLHYEDANIDTDPLFENSSSNFHLTAQSPCIDAGIADYTWQNQQVMAIPDSLYTGLAPDMGCFEYDGTAAGGSAVPGVTKLLGNYPNPFNPTTEIRFQVSDASQLEHTHIEIFNVKGQKVKQLKADMSSRAKSRDLTFSITWDGTDSVNKPVASGVYLYQLKAGDKTIDQRKMMMLK